MSYRGYRVRIYPNKEQTKKLSKTLNCVRFVYNLFLEKRIKLREEHKPDLTYNMCIEELNELIEKEEFKFLAEVDYRSLKQALYNLDKTFKRYKETPNVGFPRYKSKRSKNSFTTPNINKSIELVSNTLILPEIGQVKYRQQQKLPAKYWILSATVTKTPSTKYYVSLLISYKDKPKEEPKTNKCIGLDYSMQGLYVDSDGNEPNYPHYLRLMEDKMSREQRKMSHMQKNSKNSEKQRIIVARIYEKISNQRKDFLHKQSTILANEYDYICIENLDLKEMMTEKHFGKSINDNAWHKFTKYLEYKLQDRGKKLIKVDRYYASSQICSYCGYINNEIKDFTIREWDCPFCGKHHNRDVNAAINIKNEGMKKINYIKKKNC